MQLFALLGTNFQWLSQPLESAPEINGNTVLEWNIEKAGGISTLKTCSVFPVTQPMSMSGLHLRLSGKCYQDLLHLSIPLTSDHSFLTSEQLNHTPGSYFSTVSLGHTFPSSNMGNWRRTEAMNLL